MRIVGLLISGFLGFLWGIWLTQASDSDFDDK